MKQFIKLTKFFIEESIGFIDGFERANELFALYNVSQQRELLNALADDFNDSTDTYVRQTKIEEVLKAFNCG